jgi:hypothetical protein
VARHRREDGGSGRIGGGRGHGGRALAAAPLHPGDDQDDQPEDEPDGRQGHGTEDPGQHRRHDVLAERDGELTFPTGLDDHAVRAGLVDVDGRDFGAAEAAEGVVERVLGRSDRQRSIAARDRDVELGGRIVLAPHSDRFTRLAWRRTEVPADLALALVVDGVLAGLLEGHGGGARATFHSEAPEVLDAVPQVEHAGHGERGTSEQSAREEEAADPVPPLARLDLRAFPGQ